MSIYDIQERLLVAQIPRRKGAVTTQYIYRPDILSAELDIRQHPGGNPIQQTIQAKFKALIGFSDGALLEQARTVGYWPVATSR